MIFIRRDRRHPHSPVSHSIKKAAAARVRRSPAPASEHPASLRQGRFDFAFIVEIVQKTGKE
jgi:hypothetical protein